MRRYFLGRGGWKNFLKTWWNVEFLYSGGVGVFCITSRFSSLAATTSFCCSDSLTSPSPFISAGSAAATLSSPGSSSGALASRTPGSHRQNRRQRKIWCFSRQTLHDTAVFIRAKQGGGRYLDTKLRVQRSGGVFICAERERMAFRPFGRWLTSSGLLWKATGQPQTLRNLSQGLQSAANGGRRRFYLLVGVGSCAVGVVWGLSRAREESTVRVLPVARAGGSEKGEEKPKVSARELRYKSFASYVYKGEPYMSARDFLESVIRDEPRCESCYLYSAI